jgi:serine protease Do
MNPTWLLLAVSFFALAAHAEPDRKLYQKIWPSIVRVYAVMEQGKTASGSGIVVAPDKVISNCHVTRDARAIDLVAWNSKWKVKEQIKDIDHDLCLLIVTREIGKPIEFGDSTAMNVGQEVVAAGYPGGGRLEVTDGQIRGLHSLDGGRVIQSSAPFDSGESGGGLFDRDGKLLGVITFKSQAGGAFFFAVPVTWVQKLMQASAIEFEGMKKSEAFWERLPGDQPPFMRAIAHEAMDDWNGLYLYANQWIKDDAANPESWVALGKSLFQLKRYPDALDALKKATELDPNHGQAWLFLARLYRNTGDKNALSIAEEKLSRLDATAAKSFGAETAR